MDHTRSIIEEILECYHVHGVREIDFFDAVFYLNHKEIDRVLDELIRLKLDLEWSCRSRVDIVGASLLRKARRAGCRQIYFGIESINQDVLRRIQKNIGDAQVRDALRECKRSGIRTMGFFMIGNEGETEASVLRSIEYACQLPLDFAQFCMAIAKPGTDYDRTMIEATGHDYWREYILGERDDSFFPRPWSELDDDTVRRLARRAYARFYLRPSTIARFLARIRSFKEVTRHARIAFRLIEETGIVRR